MLTRTELKEFLRQAMWGPGEPLKNRLTKEEVFFKKSIEEGNGRCGLCEFYLNGGACQKVIGSTTREMVCHRYHMRK